MRSFLLALIPGMAVAALAGQDLPQLAEVSYGYAGPLKASAWQVGTECYVPASETRAWGWEVEIGRFEATVHAEGRTVRVPFRVQAGKQVLPLGQIVKQLGASSGWRVGTRTFEVWSVPSRIKVGPDSVDVEAPFPIRGKWSRGAEPGKVALELYGARLEAYSEVELPASARIGQVKPDLVRIVMVSDLAPPEELSEPSRSCTFNLGLSTRTPGNAPEELAVPTQRTAPPGEPTGPASPVLIEPGGSASADQKPLAHAGPVSVLQDGPGTAVLDIPLSTALAGPPRISRPEPNVLRLVLPGAIYAPPEVGFEYKGSVEKVAFEPTENAAVIDIFLSRPMGAEMSYSAKGIKINLIKPDVGNGKLAGKLIVVDAGHGGHDTGARSPDKKTREKDLTLKIATKVAAVLASEGATVIMTRKSDVFIPLKERSEIANRNNADFFISCHINSNKTGRSTGTIAFHHAQDSIGILLAECLEREIAKTSKLKDMGVWSDQRIYSSGFAVLRYAKMPAVLLELGFINHAGDRGRMTSASYPADIAKAVARGLKVFLGDVKD